jgi:hypothetical protein
VREGWQGVIGDNQKKNIKEMKCENYIYLQGQAAAFLAACSLVTQRYARSKSNHTAKTCLGQGSETESCQSSQFTETSKNSMEDLGAAQLTFFAEDSPARTSVRRVKEQELPESVRDFGRSMRESLEKSGLNLCLPKTHHCFELGALELSSKIWPRWGMMQGGACWELGTLVRPTNATGCGSWPTPCRRDYKGTNAPEGLTRKDGKSRLDQLPNAVAYRGTQTQQKWLWPTPTTQPKKGGTKGLYGGSGHQRKMKQAGHHSMLTGQLNPSWVEWLMGWPIEWTDLKPLETDKYRHVQQWHSEFYHKD